MQPPVALNCVTSGQSLVLSVALLTPPTSSGPPRLRDADDRRCRTSLLAVCRPAFQQGFGGIGSSCWVLWFLMPAPPPDQGLERGLTATILPGVGQSPIVNIVNSQPVKNRKYDVQRNFVQLCNIFNLIKSLFLLCPPTTTLHISRAKLGQCSCDYVDVLT